MAKAPKKAAGILRGDKRGTARKTEDDVQKSKKGHKLLFNASLRRPGWLALVSGLIFLFVFFVIECYV